VRHRCSGEVGRWEHQRRDRGGVGAVNTTGEKGEESSDRVEAIVQEEADGKMIRPVMQTGNTAARQNPRLGACVTWGRTKTKAQNKQNPNQS